MWVVFCESASNFQFVDKNVVALVNDADILTYQSTFSGYYFPVNIDVSYFQEFVRDTEGRLYFARRYEVFTTQ